MNPVGEHGTRYEAAHGRSQRRALPRAYISRARALVVEHHRGRGVRVGAHVVVDAAYLAQAAQVAHVVVQAAVGTHHAGGDVQVVLEAAGEALELPHDLVDLGEHLEEHLRPRRLHGCRRGQEHAEGDGGSQEPAAANDGAPVRIGRGRRHGGHLRMFETRARAAAAGGRAGPLPLRRRPARRGRRGRRDEFHPLGGLRTRSRAGQGARADGVRAVGQGPHAGGHVVEVARVGAVRERGAVLVTGRRACAGAGRGAWHRAG